MSETCPTCERPFSSLRALRGHQNRRGSACRLTAAAVAEAKRTTQRRYRARPGYREAHTHVQRRYRATPAGRAVFDEAQRSQRAGNKGKARIAVTNAVRSGRLVRRPCEVCGEPRTHAHHYNGYEPQHWLDVRWLCQPHHQAAHNAAAGR